MIVSERALFDVPSGIAYFNTASFSAQLDRSRDALVAAAGLKSHPWEKTPSSYFDDAERVRLLAAGALGGEPDGYAVVPSASYGISTAARAIEPRLRPGDEIVIWAEEFPSAFLPWQRVGRETGARLVVVPPGDDWTSAFLAHITSRTKVVALGACHWTNGSTVNVEAVADAARRVGAAVVLDLTQSLGAMPLAFDRIQPDFVAASGYKWLLFPYGVSLLYVGPRWREARALEESWITRDNARDFAGLVTYSDGYLPGARRFEVGETATALLPGAIAALEQLTLWSVPAIAERLSAINARIANRLAALGFDLPPAGRRAPHMFGAKLPAGFEGDLVGALRERNIFIAQRGTALRFSPHLHIDEADLDRLFGALDEVLRR
jgi:selenocysteine lyase/cysteine desulfurase